MAKYIWNDCKDKCNDSKWSHLRTAQNQHRRRSTLVVYLADMGKGASKGYNSYNPIACPPAARNHTGINHK